jgi:hypothetical protein
LKRLFVVLIALFLGAGTALAQSEGSSIEIVDINGSRYAEGGQTTMVVNFTNFTESPDPGLLQITTDGEPVSNLEVRALGESSVPVRIAHEID